MSRLTCMTVVVQEQCPLLFVVAGHYEFLQIVLVLQVVGDYVDGRLFVESTSLILGHVGPVCWGCRGIVACFKLSIHPQLNDFRYNVTVH